ncbi:outer membrane protein assembly factor BamB family protein [Natrarchaeobius oligotrophus]|uniref:Pyrrolo-quinoline quinone n=1 Tax=Natrarchaeobius chitinivorans TaxID=1679083 RepID=A0A3N6MAQ0_NATCH|nr:PQQ-binding-like beta-propeller repeat protein [Natrarchaeobius chitinivorans]RQH00884.1 pyrrolo-quinoline quinone [Natrarchaeobius chitinivorans]
MTDWNQFKGDRRNGGVRRDLEGPHRVREAWTADLVGPVGSPVLDRDTVYVGTSRGNLYAFERETGRRRWVFETTVGTDATPIVTRDHLWLGTDDGTIVALDPGTGEERWRTELPGALTTSLSHSNGRLYAGHEAGVSALEIEAGDLEWTTETDGAAVGSPAVDDRREWSGERVFLGTDDETIRALEGETGEECWDAPTDGVAADGPTCLDGRVYVADDDGTLLALDGETGQSWFTYEIRDAFTSSATVVPGESDDASPTEETHDGEPDGTTFVGADDGYLHVTDTTFGRRKVRGWLFAKKGIALDGEINSSPVVVGDVVCVGDSTGSIYGIDADEYDHLWYFSTDGAIASTPAVGTNRLFVGSDDERLYCLEWTPGEPKP